MGPLQRFVIGGALTVAALSAAGCASGTRATSAGGSTAPSSSTSTPVAAPTCPASYQGINAGWVPAQPQGVDGQNALAPKTTPSAVTVCAYLHTTANQGLTGSKELTGNLAPLAAAMSKAPSESASGQVACPQYFRQVDADDYLIALRYPAGLIWVAAPRFHCAGSTNGQFTSSTNFGDNADAWYQAGSVTPSSAPTS